MYYALLTFPILIQVVSSVSRKNTCDVRCPLSSKDGLVCAFDTFKHKYAMFPSECAMLAYRKCNSDDLVETPLKFCIKAQLPRTRKMYGESCPLFCPSHYRPVCAASNIREYMYRVFNNGCYLDMINCRGDDDFAYTEVPLEFCPQHAMKNIFKEQVILSGVSGHEEFF